MKMFSLSHKEIAKRELDEAERELLKAQAALEYARAMCQYHTDRIKRLSVIVQEEKQVGVWVSRGHNTPAPTPVEVPQKK